MSEQADIALKSTGSSTEYHITGSLGAVFKAIDAIFNRKHPMGYGTKVKSISMQQDGQYAAEVWHANSCD